MALCTGCEVGLHPHDTWGANAPEVRSGERNIGDDAGCPRLDAASKGCTCRHVKPPKGQPPHCATCRCGVSHA